MRIYKGVNVYKYIFLIKLMCLIEYDGPHGKLNSVTFLKKICIYWFTIHSAKIY